MNPAGQPPRAADLTNRECQILVLVARGLTAVACGHRLGIAPGTVRKHLEHVYAKLGVNDRLMAVSVARARGLLQDFDWTL